MKEKAERLIEESDLLPELKPQVKHLLGYSIGMELEVVKPGILPLGSSKIGGRPNLPPGFSWPWKYEVTEHSDQKEATHLLVPQVFVAQLNFRDIHPLSNCFPEKGILYIWDHGGSDEEDWKISFYDGDEHYLLRTKYPGEEEENKFVEHETWSKPDFYPLEECRIQLKPIGCCRPFLTKRQTLYLIMIRWVGTYMMLR